MSITVNDVKQSEITQLKKKLESLTSEKDQLLLKKEEHVKQLKTREEKIEAQRQSNTGSHWQWQTCAVHCVAQL